jgi:hypothetical protein
MKRGCRSEGLWLSRQFRDEAPQDVGAPVDTLRKICIRRGTGPLVHQSSQDLSGLPRGINFLGEGRIQSQRKLQLVCVALALQVAFGSACAVAGDSSRRLRIAGSGKCLHGHNWWLRRSPYRLAKAGSSILPCWLVWRGFFCGFRGWGASLSEAVDPRFPVFSSCVHVRGVEGAKFEMKGVTWQGHSGVGNGASHVECGGSEPGRARSFETSISEAEVRETGDSPTPQAPTLGGPRCAPR